MFEAMKQQCLWWIVSGDAFFVGVVLLAAGLFLGKSWGRGLVWPTLLGGVLICAAAPPWSLGFSLTLSGTTVVACLAPVGVSRRVLTSAAALLCVWGCSSELLSRRFSAAAPVPTPLAVIGDSLTAGQQEPDDWLWPAQLAAGVPGRIRNLAFAGANCRTALQQAAKLTAEDQTVVLAIGGNDMLGFTTPPQFEHDLRALIKAVKQPERCIIHLELPTLPTMQAFGEIQRRVCREQGVILIPKSLMLAVLLSPNATVDSIHLSQTGHQAMANAMSGVLFGMNP